MKKDISFLPVENVLISIAKEDKPGEEAEWRVYVINRNETPLETLMVTSKGYGKKDGEEQKTSTLRHVIPKLEGGEYALIEPIQPDVFHLTNEFWVSYFIHGQVYDKKFLFVPDTIKEENLIEIKELGLMGILHT